MTVTTFKVSPTVAPRQEVSAIGPKTSREFLEEPWEPVQKRAVLCGDLLSESLGGDGQHSRNAKWFREIAGDSEVDRLDCARLG